MSDLLADWVPGEGFFFSHRGIERVGIGAARTITVPAGPDQVGRAAAMAERALAEHGGMVVGAIPFAPTVPATLVIPREVRTRAEPQGWMRPVPDAADLRITPVPAPEAYVAAVEKARARIRAGELDKVVLARMLVAQADHVFDRRALLARLRAAEPDAFIFAVQGFIGATPELLIRRSAYAIHAQPLAGTIARRAPDAEARLLGSDKDRHEHGLVVDAVRAALDPVCGSLSVTGPRVVATSAVLHLATDVEGILRQPAPSSLGLAALLHPTPAVCGTPTDAAARAIGDLEDIDRALYAGLVGWMDAEGNGEWAIALRCAEVAGRIALLFAGAGIVADSDPDAELAETDAKFLAMLEALGYA